MEELIALRAPEAMAAGEYNMQPAFEAVAVNAMHRGDAILIGLVV